MPEPNPPLKVMTERCRCLRAKEMFVDGEMNLQVAGFGSGVFWCVHTQNCLGPDSRVADLENCKPGRACYESV